MLAMLRFAEIIPTFAKYGWTLIHLKLLDPVHLLFQHQRYYWELQTVLFRMKSFPLLGIKFKLIFIYLYSLTDMGAAVGTKGQCLDDQFAISVPGGQSTNVICGKNTGEHCKSDFCWWVELS